ncbi:MAG: peptide ABC transporter substrate-binding protein [Bdellovibrionales bacterium]
MVRFLKAVSIGLVVVLSGLSWGAHPRDSLTIGYLQYSDSLMPLLSGMASTRLVAGFVLRPVTVTDEHNQLGCLLCDELPTFENGQAKSIEVDGKVRHEVTFRLKEGLLWSDGRPLTADDVIFTWDVIRYREPSNFRGIDEIRKIDERTFVVVRSKMTVEYNSLDGIYVLARHLAEDAFLTNPKEFHIHAPYVASPTRAGLYSGPYVIRDVEVGRSIVLERNSFWRGPKPPFERIVLLAYDQAAPLGVALMAGDIDMICGEAGYTEFDAQQLQKTLGRRHRIDLVQSMRYERIAFNFSNPILQDRRVRQALKLGLDRKTLVRNLFGQEPINFVYRQELETEDIKYDRTEAIRLLEEAGWQASGGVRVKSGTPLTLTLSTTSGQPGRLLVAQAVQSAWRKIGVRLQIEPQVPRVLFGEILPKGRFDLELTAIVGTHDEATILTGLFGSDAIPTESNGWIGHNYGRYSNPRFDQLLLTLESIIDKAERRKLLQRLYALAAEDAIDIPLYSPRVPYILPDWLEVRGSPNTTSSSLWVEHWKISER